MSNDLTCALWQVGQVRATRRFSTCDQLVTLLWTPASGIRLAGGDDGDGGDEEEDYDDDDDEEETKEEEEDGIEKTFKEKIAAAPSSSW